MKVTAENDTRRQETAASLAALTLANAFIFQAELAEADPRIQPLRATLDQPDPISAFTNHWKFICDTINYVPIFHLARDVLLQMPPRSEVVQALRDLGDHILGIVSERAALRHDLMGRIYHRLLLEAKYLGTFYTSVPAATLLLKLALAADRWNVDWSDMEAIRRLRIADLACGTGTLLMAAQQAVTDNYVRAAAAAGKNIGSSEMRSLHQAMMEDVLHGYDVLPSAVHLTASTLALLAPEIAFRRMHLYLMPLGEQPGGSLALGSIDFLTQESLPVQLDLMGEVPVAGPASEVTGAGHVASEAPVPRLDLCVMNPPFTRSVGGNLLFGSLPKVQRDKMQRKLKGMLAPRRRGFRPIMANATAGLGSVFVAVGDRHLQSDGRMALVLPAAMSAGEAWEKTRQLLAQSYVVETLVVSHDPARWNFSENTDLSEILVVARKRTGLHHQTAVAKTVCVNLWRNMTTAVDALAVADSILRTEPADLEVEGSGAHAVASLVVNGVKRGEMISASWLSLRQDQWYQVAFAQTDLTRAAHFLRQGKCYIPRQGVVKDLSMVTLSTVGELGPDRRDIYDGFDLSQSATSYPALWSHRADEVVSLETNPNSYLTPLNRPRPGRSLRDAGLLWKRAGRLMLAERMWLVTQRLVAVRLPNEALSNVWWPLKLCNGSEDHEKMLALWLNSTLGLITLLSHRVPTRGPWVQFKKADLGRVKVLDLATLSPSEVTTLVDAYDELQHETLLPLPQMAHDDTRAKIDAAFERALQLPSLEVLRQALAREPVVCAAPLYQG